MPTQPSKELETIPNPNPDRDYEVRMECPEFTCLCPRTGQPDFATFTITYTPGELCVEPPMQAVAGLLGPVIAATLLANAPGAPGGGGGLPDSAEHVRRYLDGRRKQADRT